MLILSYENELNLHVNEISFSYERMSTKTRFEEEAKGNSEMAYLSMKRYMFSPTGSSVLGKTVPELSSTALGLRPCAALETSGTVFPNTDRPRPVNNIFIY